MMSWKGGGLWGLSNQRARFGSCDQNVGFSHSIRGGAWADLMVRGDTPSPSIG